MHTDWLKIIIISITRWRHRTSTSCCIMMLARAKRMYILIIKVKKVVFLFPVAVYMYSVFLSSYTCRNTHESLGELEKAVETLACGSCSHSISRSPKLPLVFLYFNRNTVHVSYFLTETHFCYLNTPLLQYQDY